MRLRTVVALCAVFVLVVVAPEAGGTAGVLIDHCGQVLTTSGFMGGDLNCSGSPGVVVGASGITIDLKGYVLRGDRSVFLGIDDSGDFDGVTIKNGVVRNFNYGVYTQSGDNISISNLVVSGNQLDGILVGGVGAKVKASNVSSNGLNGVEVGAAAIVQSTVASGNGNLGIGVSGAGAKVQSSTAIGNEGVGIHGTGAGVKVLSSTATGNGQDGILVASEGARVQGNRAEANGFLSGIDDSGRGIWVLFATTPPSGTNTARGNDDPAECNPSYLC